MMALDMEEMGEWFVSGGEDALVKVKCTTYEFIDFSQAFAFAFACFRTHEKQNTVGIVYYASHLFHYEIHPIRI